MEADPRTAAPTSVSRAPISAVAGPVSATDRGSSPVEVSQSRLETRPSRTSRHVLLLGGRPHDCARGLESVEHEAGRGELPYIGVEHAGFSDREILDNPAQMTSSLALTRWLRCRYGIAIGNVIGHNESLSSPYHHENVARLRSQAHQDWSEADMDVYRRRLASARC